MRIPLRIDEGAKGPLAINPLLGSILAIENTQRGIAGCSLAEG